MEDFMRNTARVCFAILTLVGISALLPTTVDAGILPPAGDISGDWTLPTTCTLPPGDEDCVFEGSASLLQDGNQIGGQATLMLVSGPDSCPSEMMATVMGTLSGLDLFGTLDGGQLLGILNFNGGASPDLQMIQGTSMAPDGQPFAGTTCDWDAQRQEAVFIPTLSGVGLALLVALLLGGGLLMLRRRTVA
jgi:hypothetical protein